MPHTLTLPSVLPPPGVDGFNAAEHGLGSAGQVLRHPHTRAQLSAIIRQHRSPVEGYADDGDDPNRVNTTLVNKVASLLADEQEDASQRRSQVRVRRRRRYGQCLVPNLSPLIQSNPSQLEQHVLDLMHRHRDDVAGVPFLFLTPTRRPSRPSSRASSHSVRHNRPDTPSSVPNSPFSIGFRRPHTPVASPLVSGNASSYITARSVSPMNSPVLTHSQVTQAHIQLTASLPASPISSPRLLSAKATEFKPIPRPLSAASSNPATLPGYGRTDTPSPDLWSHSPLRATSNLAIAAPLLPDQNVLSRAVTPSQLRSSTRVGDDEEEEDDPFDPFAPKTAPHSFHPITVTDFDQWSDSALSSQSPDDLRAGYYSTGYDYDSQYDTPGEDPDTSGYLTDGMTPLDVLSSVFGSTLAPSELEEALSQNGYDFEKAMAWLIDRALPSPPQHTHARMQPMGGRVTLVTRDGAAPMLRGGRSGYTNVVEIGCADTTSPANVYERIVDSVMISSAPCADSGCAGHVDVTTVTNALSRTNLHHSVGNPTGTSNLPSDEFPALGFDGSGLGNNKRAHGNWQHDPGRTRFAAAVKRPVPAPVLTDRAMVTRREPLSSANSADNLQLRTTIVAPKPSPRIKLRPPTLLPTLPTGESISDLYMSYRSRALQLGAARNACLSRAADAWRRGDGAAAKRFSREGHDLNSKMSNEMTEAAGRLVRERVKLTEQAVKSRDLNWSDDLGDRSARGRACGGGLGVCLGIASKDVGGESRLSSEERTEAMLDLHGLHSSEATEVLEEFVLAHIPSLERRSTRELKTQQGGLRALASLQVLENGCIAGVIRGANATASYASIP
ncbi:hypothetical protein J3R82DRAFT_2357 [Butyriboletus roseoflavus]|nr:hypothetical protein J3R82DRAFT_2357 [Butyriboletus roseoflavus]